MQRGAHYWMSDTCSAFNHVAHDEQMSFFFFFLTSHPTLRYLVLCIVTFCPWFQQQDSEHAARDTWTAAALFSKCLKQTKKKIRCGLFGNIRQGAFTAYKVRNHFMLSSIYFSSSLFVLIFVFISNNLAIFCKINSIITVFLFIGYHQIYIQAIYLSQLMWFHS